MIKFSQLEKKYNLKIVQSYLAKNNEEAINFAKEIGYPVALKIESEDILHKTDIGGVKLNLNTDLEVKEAYNRIIESVKKNKPNAKIKGMMIQEMLHDGFELILGYDNHPIYGPSVMLGLGGIFTEVFKDVVFRILPITKVEAYEMIDRLKFSKILLDGYRNIEKVNKDMLADVIYKTSKMAMNLTSSVDSFDINPVIVWGEQYRIVDFKIVPLKEKLINNKEKPNIENIDKFFNAKSIALLGASKIPEKIGYIILNNLLNNGYKGKIYPINPKYKKIEGVKTYPSILDVKENIDLAVMIISLKAGPCFLEQCKKKGIKNMVIISGGGKEVGEASLEDDIKEKAAKLGIRIIGCNCLGVFDSYSRVDTLFQPYNEMIRPKRGAISFITQSGTVGIAYLEMIEKYGISKFISYGNRIDVDEGDLISFLGNDPKTNVIVAYIEGLEKGRKFFEAAKKTSPKKPIVVYKAGRTPRASRASFSHTGFLAGTFNVVSGVMDQANIIAVDNFESMLAASKILSVKKRTKGNRVLTVTNGAGVIIQAMDRIGEKNKLELTELSDKSKNILKSKMPSYVAIGNPIDLTGSGTNKDYEMVLETLKNDINVDIILVWFVFQVKTIVEGISKILEKYFKESKKPIIYGAKGGEYTKKIGNSLEKNRVPIFYSVEEWVSAAEAVSYKK